MWKLNISSYGISVPTLEDVFLRVSNEKQVTKPEEEDNNNKDNDEPETTNIDQDIAFYEESNQADDFIKYWQNNCEKLPILTAFVKRYCIISATSVPREAAFSIANYLQRK